MSKTEQLISGLDGVRKTGPNSWIACCPAHEDGTPSLAIKETDDGVVLLHCFGGCSVDAVAAAAGVDLRDLFPDGPTPYTGKKQLMPVREAAEKMRQAALKVLMAAAAIRKDIKDAGFDDLDTVKFESLVTHVGELEYWRETIQRANA